MVKQIPLTIIAQYTVPANATANNIYPVNFIVDPQKGAQSDITIPKGEAWVLEDIFVTSAPSIDGLVQIFKNDYTLEIQTDPLSTLVVSNPAKPKYPKKVYVGFDKISAKAINLAAGGASATTITFYIKISRFVS